MPNQHTPGPRRVQRLVIRVTDEQLRQVHALAKREAGGDVSRLVRARLGLADPK